MSTAVTYKSQVTGAIELSVQPGPICIVYTDTLLSIVDQMRAIKFEIYC